MQGIISLFGCFVLLGCAYALSENRKAIKLRVVCGAFLTQAILAAFVLYVPAGQQFILKASGVVQSVFSYSDAGINFLFGSTADKGNVGFVFFMHVLPVMIFLSALMSVLYYLGIMQKIVSVIGTAIHKLLGTSKTESMAATSNIFVGTTDVYLVMKPYTKTMTKSELFALMVGGCASIAGAVMAGFAAMGIDLQFLLAASFMSAPGGLLMAKMIVPETEQPKDLSEIDVNGGNRPANMIDAASRGAFDGIKLAAIIAANLMAIISLIALLNGMLGGLGGYVGLPSLSLEVILGYLFMPFALILGVPFSEATTVASFLGQKLALNEFVAYSGFAPIKETLSMHSQAVLTFALAGFSGLSAMAAMLGVLGGMVPERKSFIAKVALKGVLAGTLSNMMSAALAGFFLSLA